MPVSAERAAAIEAAFDSKPAEEPEKDTETPESGTTTDDDSQGQAGAPDTEGQSGKSPADSTPEGGSESPEKATPKDGETTESTAAETEGRQRGPDGKFLGKDGQSAKKEAIEIAPDADVVETPVPESLKKSTREYVERVQGAAKEARAERDQFKGDFELLVAPIRESGATPEQFQSAMQLVRLLNSQNPSEQAQALQQLQTTANALAQRLGHVPAGTDPLEGQQDLIAAVQGGKMPREYAEEVAKARLQSQAQARWQKEQQAKQQQTTAQQAEVQRGKEAVTGIEAALKASDPNYAAKVAVLAKDQAFIAQMNALPPAQWASVFAAKYATIQAPAPAVARAAAGPQPLRAKTPAGTSSVERQAGSVGEAIRAMREKKMAQG